MEVLTISDMHGCGTEHEAPVQGLYPPAPAPSPAAEEAGAGGVLAGADATAPSSAAHEARATAPAAAAAASHENGGRRPRLFPNKTYFFLSARVHPGESPAQWMWEGFMDFLLGDCARNPGLSCLLRGCGRGPRPCCAHANARTSTRARRRARMDRWIDRQMHVQID